MDVGWAGLAMPAVGTYPEAGDLAAVEMHAIQTSGNCIRNITSDALAGIAPDEIVDPRPYCEILRQWSTLHPEFAFLPRKFKIAVSGAREDRAAIGWHDIGLQLRRNRDGTGDLRETLIDLYGLDVARQLLHVEGEHGEGADGVQVRGMVSPPGITRGSRGYLHVFVNRRAIQPRGQIAFVIEEAYHTLLMKGRHPIAVLDIRVHPGAVDVNIHPTKSEVKFRDGPRVMSALGRAIRDALLAGGGVALVAAAAVVGSSVVMGPPQTGEVTTEAASTLRPAVVDSSAGSANTAASPTVCAP